MSFNMRGSRKCGTSLQWKTSQPSKEQTIDTLNNMDESQMHSKGTKPDVNTYVWSDSGDVLGKAKCRDRKHVGFCQGLGLGTE